MNYTIEDNVPIPSKKAGAKIGARTAWTQTLEKLEPGQSVITPNVSDAKAAEQYRYRVSPRDYLIRKVPHVGWRVWRVA
jgi:hydroxymethylpyrimidine/phosphomethylpyrimidine kinase